MRILTGRGFDSNGNMFYDKQFIDQNWYDSEYNLPYEEVARINRKFFSKPYHKQRSVLRLLIWWAVKHYFKIIFK